MVKEGQYRDTLLDSCIDTTSCAYQSPLFSHFQIEISVAALFSATGGFGSAIHIEYVDFVPEFWSLIIDEYKTQVPKYFGYLGNKSA